MDGAIANDPVAADDEEYAEHRVHERDAEQQNQESVRGTSGRGPLPGRAKLSGAAPAGEAGGLLINVVVNEQPLVAELKRF